MAYIKTKKRHFKPVAKFQSFELVFSLLSIENLLRITHSLSLGI